MEFNEEMLKWGFGAFISYYVIKELIRMISKFLRKTEENTDRLVDKVEQKVDKPDCLSFRRRIGKESDDHRGHIIEIKEDITEIKEGVAYLKGKAG